MFIGICSFLLLASCASLSSEIFPYDLVPKEGYFPKPTRLDVLSSKGLRLTTPKGKRVTELSGISWSADEKILYAVNDEGMLYHLSITVKENVIADVNVLAEYPLLDRNKKPLTKKWNDSEGLSSRYNNNGVQGDTELIVSFEGKPRIIRYSTEGKYIGEVKLPGKLWRKKRYRHKNNGLESVVVHPTEGIITAAEFPLKEKKVTSQTLYSASGKEWNFKASKAKKSAITGLEVLPNGNVLILERAWAGIDNPIVISLSELDLEVCKPDTCCKLNNIASLSSTEGWLLDNFEGLAHYQDNQYWVVSDDNDKKFQTTVLVLFEIKKDATKKMAKNLVK